MEQEEGSTLRRLTLSRGRLFIFRNLSLALVALGVVSISWAVFSMVAQHERIIYATPGNYSLSSPEQASSALSEPELSEASYPEFSSRSLGAGSPNIPPLERRLPLLYEEGGAASPVAEFKVVLYPVYPAIGDNIGSLTIPALDRRLPIYHGTNDYELVKGVGHFAQSVLPGEACNSVLSGHRDTVFRNLYNVEIGHRLIVETSAGIFTYEVNGIRIVHADDKTVIVPTGRAVLTLTTCYPFYAIGNAPDRYIVSAELVESLLKGDSP